MKSIRFNFLIGMGIYILIMFLLSYSPDIQDKELRGKNKNFEKKEEFSNEPVERNQFFFRLLRDPATNSIPYHIREKELKFARKLEQKNKLMKLTKVNSLQWKEAGPIDVGGRTRALAVDVMNSNIVIAGGASGGIWKSTDNGNSWRMKSRTDQLLSVTSVAQDPRPGHTNTWYFSGGEYDGTAGTDIGYSANFIGNGIYKSTDNGESWNVIAGTLDSDPSKWNSSFDYTSKIIVNPKTGSIFVADISDGILSSTDGNTFSISLGQQNAHVYNDVVVTTTGTLIASISGPFQGVTPDKQPGIYKSTDDGTSWTSITPNDFPSTNGRTVLGVTAANPDIVYVLTNTGQQDQNKHDILKFYKINTSNNSYEDRSNNLPDFTNLGDQKSDGYLASQRNYNMTLAVKPDDENFVLIGCTSLFRSTNGFAAKPADPVKDWIGGYNPVSFDYPNFHSDVHSFAFDPNDPKKMWWGNDGGLAYTSDITSTSFTSYFPWENKNNGYDVTQYYMISISKNTNDDRFMGGCQDNGTPFYRFDGNSTSFHVDGSSGDGGYSYIGSDFAYSESQNGNLMRLHYDQSGNIIPPFVGNNSFSIITPANASNQLFVNPFVVNPADENMMFYLAGGDIWRNNSLSSIPDNQNGTSFGWTKLNNLSAPQNNIMTTISISTSPTNILYYAETDFNTAPKLFKLENANTATSGAVDITVPNSPQGAYISNIAVNPDDANEIIVVMSNYNIVGLYHSTDGGKNYTAIEGNLQGDQQNPGPSLRGATLLPTNNGTVYYVATSIGVFSTTQLNGDNTQWVQEGADIIGNVVSSYITSRKSDGKVAVATHGRGAFIGSGNGTSSGPILTLSTNQLNIGIEPGLTGKTEFNLSNTGTESLNFSITASGGPAKILGNINASKSELLPSNKLNNTQNRTILKPGSVNADKKSSISIHKPTSEDVLILDDGNDYPDSFIGIGVGDYVYWRNDFSVTKDFALQKIRWYMKTETQINNTVEITVDTYNSTLFDTTVFIDTSYSGSWYEFQVPQYALKNLEFHNGDNFIIIIGAQNPNYNYPAGYDKNGTVTGNSYYGYFYNNNNQLVFSGWTNLMSTQGFEQSAWLIRAVGNSTTTGRFTILPQNGNVPPSSNQNISVTFDAQGLNEGTYQAQLNITSNGGNTVLPVIIYVSNTVDVKTIDEIPSEFVLKQNYPNPFNPTTTINYSLPQNSFVTLKIYDILGKEIKTLIQQNEAPGNYSVKFNGDGLASGIYIYKIQANNLESSSGQIFSDTKKFFLLKSNVYGENN